MFLAYVFTMVLSSTSSVFTPSLFYQTDCRCVPASLPCERIGLRILFSFRRLPEACLPGLTFCCDNKELEGKGMDQNHDFTIPFGGPEDGHLLKMNGQDKQDSDKMIMSRIWEDENFENEQSKAPGTIYDSSTSMKSEVQPPAEEKHMAQIEVPVNGEHELPRSPYDVFTVIPIAYERADVLDVYVNGERKLPSTADDVLTEVPTAHERALTTRALALLPPITPTFDGSTASKYDINNITIPKMEDKYSAKDVGSIVFQNASDLRSENLPRSDEEAQHTNTSAGFTTERLASSEPRISYINYFESTTATSTSVTSPILPATSSYYEATTTTAASVNLTMLPSTSSYSEPSTSTTSLSSPILPATSSYYEATATAASANLTMLPSTSSYSEPNTSTTSLSSSILPTTSSYSEPTIKDSEYFETTTSTTSTIAPSDTLSLSDSTTFETSHFESTPATIPTTETPDHPEPISSHLWSLSRYLETLDTAPELPILSEPLSTTNNYDNIATFLPSKEFGGTEGLNEISYSTFYSTKLSSESIESTTEIPSTLGGANVSNVMTLIAEKQDFDFDFDEAAIEETSTSLSNQIEMQTTKENTISTKMTEIYSNTVHDHNQIASLKTNDDTEFKSSVDKTYNIKSRGDNHTEKVFSHYVLTRDFALRNNFNNITEIISNMYNSKLDSTTNRNVTSPTTPSKVNISAISSIHSVTLKPIHIDSEYITESTTEGIEMSKSAEELDRSIFEWVINIFN